MWYIMVALAYCLCVWSSIHPMCCSIVVKLLDRQLSPVTKGIALLCTASTSDMLHLVDGSNTVDAYSSCNRAGDL